VDTITVALFLLLAVAVSGAFARMLSLLLPLPLVQIGFGAAIASVANLGVELQLDSFFLLFLPPLLFLDGWRIPKEGLFRDKGTILALALGLVVFTVAGVGYILLGCSTGISVGFVPRKILSTISAARRDISGKSGPYDIRPSAGAFCRMPCMNGGRVTQRQGVDASRALVIMNGSRQT